MPTLRRYVNDPGYYVVAALDRRPITFQLTKDGENHLTHVLKLLDRSHFDMGVLLHLIRQRWVYTNHSGPGQPLPTDEEMQGDNSEPESLKIEQAYAARAEHHVVFRFESTDLGALDSAIERMVKAFLENGVTILGPIPLPTRVECYKILSESTVKEYRVYTHKRMMTLIDPQSTLLHRAGNLEVPPGVDVKLKERTLVVPLAGTSYSGG
jgi:small subunit ribosomal protein S10